MSWESERELLGGEYDGMAPYVDQLGARKSGPFQIKREF